VYIGTVHLECRSAWFLSGAKHCCFIDGHLIKNEEALAQKLVSENLKTLERPKTALMQRHNEKTLIFRTPKQEK
jgi:hypothetical protein